MDYEANLKEWRDRRGELDTAFDEGATKGRMEGKIEGKKEVAKSLKTAGIAVEIIIRTTGLSADEIDSL